MPRRPRPKSRSDNSAAVFVGKVTSVEKSGFSNTFKFAVSKKWKGVNGNTASIVSASNSAACGIVFDENRDYLVYAFKTEGDDQLRTNLCTRTARVADAAADLAELGEPTKQVATPSYPIKNGVVQINAGAAADPLVFFARALQNEKTAQRLRLNWAAPTADSFTGTALYNRADSTLKVYSRAQMNGKISIESALYRGVTDAVLNRLAASDDIVEFFTKFADYGVSREELGSKTVRIN